MSILKETYIYLKITQVKWIDSVAIGIKINRDIVSS
jgi:hypothetical protein